MAAGNVIMMMYNLFVCINVHCEKVEREHRTVRVLCLIALRVLLFSVLKKERGKKRPLKGGKVLYSDCHLGSVERNK